MTLSFSPFSIKDILTGRGAAAEPGEAEELRAPKRDVCTGQGGARVPDVTRRDAGDGRVQPGRPPAGNLRSDTCSDESTGEETEPREGEQFYSIRQ